MLQENLGKSSNFVEVLTSQTEISNSQIKVMPVSQNDLSLSNVATDPLS